jgi:hypothetical protein
VLSSVEYSTVNGLLAVFLGLITFLTIGALGVASKTESFKKVRTPQGVKSLPYHGLKRPMRGALDSSKKVVSLCRESSTFICVPHLVIHSASPPRPKASRRYTRQRTRTRCLATDLNDR